MARGKIRGSETSPRPSYLAVPSRVPNGDRESGGRLLLALNGHWGSADGLEKDI